MSRHLVSRSRLSHYTNQEGARTNLKLIVLSDMLSFAVQRHAEYMAQCGTLTDKSIFEDCHGFCHLAASFGIRRLFSDPHDTFIGWLESSEQYKVEGASM